MYNIVYSVIAHQNIDFVNNFLLNLEKYNNNNKYLVILHLNNILYNNKDLIYKKYVLINDKHYDKYKPSHLLLKATVDNFDFLKKHKVSFKNFMILSSNTRFFKQAPKFTNNKYNIQLYEKEQNIELLNDWIHWKQFLKNIKIIKLFKEKKIKLEHNMVSGQLFNYNVFNLIVKFIKDNNIFSLIEYETYFDEIIIPSLFLYFTNNNPLCYCYTFSYKKYPWIPKVCDIIKFKSINKDESICIFKGFSDETMKSKIFNLI